MSTLADSYGEDPEPSVSVMVRAYYAAHPWFFPEPTKEQYEEVRRAVIAQIVAHIPIRLPGFVVWLIGRGVAEVERSIRSDMHKKGQGGLAEGGRKMRERERELARAGTPVTPEVRREMATQYALDLRAWEAETAVTATGEALPSRRDSHAADWALRNDTTHARILPDVIRYFGDREAERQVRDHQLRTGIPLTFGEMKERGLIDMPAIATAQQEGSAILVARVPGYDHEVA